MNVNLKYFLLTCLFFILGQIGVWFQLNGQFLWEWSKKNPLIMSFAGVPFTYLFILATGYGEKAFEGLLWPQRFLGFSIGILIYSILTYMLLGQGMTFKTILSLTLSVGIIIIQVLIK